MSLLIPRLHNDEDARRWARTLSVEQMKRLWDTYEEWEDRDFGCFALKALIVVMNERGEGAYVAV